MPRICCFCGLRVAVTFVARDARWRGALTLTLDKVAVVLRALRFFGLGGSYSMSV